MIYFDNAATSYYRPACVGKAVEKAIGSLTNSSRGAYGSSLNASGVLFDAREELSELFDADGPERISFTKNATEALNTALFGMDLKAGDHLIVSVLEHNSVLRPAYRLKERGVFLHVIGADSRGVLDYGELKETLNGISGKAKTAVALSHGSNVTGNVIDLEKVGNMCRKAKAVLIVDAAQTAGCIPIDMKKQKIDILCFSGHKSLMGPQGTGGIAVRTGLELMPLLLGGSGILSFLTGMPEDMPEHLEAGTQNAQAVSGLLAALRYSRGRREAWAEKETRLRMSFLDGLEKLSRVSREKGGPGITVYGDQDAQPHLPVVSFNIEGEYSSRVADFLWRKSKIAVRAGIHCAPLVHGHFGTGKQGMVRISFSHANTNAQVTILLNTLALFF